MIKGIKFVTIPVHDQDRALDFYTRTLGFTVVTDQPFNDEQRWIELRVPGADTRIVLFTPEGYEDRIGGFQPVTFWSANVQHTYDLLVGRGAQFEGPPTVADWGSSATLIDPDGNRLVVSSR